MRVCAESGMFLEMLSRDFPARLDFYQPDELGKSSLESLGKNSAFTRGCMVCCAEYID